MDCEVFIGWDPRETLGWKVAVASLLAHASVPVTVRPLWREQVESEAGIAKRPVSFRDGILYDDISDAPCATAFSIARFATPLLARARWALFCDVDFLFRADVKEIFDAADSNYAVQVVKHSYAPTEKIKMDGQPQTVYPRKNWSSCVLWNCSHQANIRGAYQRLDSWTGLRLHKFDWLDENLIGELPGGEAWNWLEGHSNPAVAPKAVHYTRGTPDMLRQQTLPYQDEWWSYARTFISKGLHP